MVVPVQVLICVGGCPLMDRVLFCPGVANVFKNGKEPSWHASSTVNVIDWWMLLMCFSSCSNHYTTKVSSTNLLPNIVWFSAVLRVTSMYMLAIIGLTRISWPLPPIVHNTHLGRENMSGGGKILEVLWCYVLLFNLWSCSNLFCTMLRAGSPRTSWVYYNTNKFL